VEAAAQVIDMSPDDLLTCYMGSLSWVDTVCQAEEQTLQADRLPAPMDFRRNPEARPITISEAK